MDINSVLADIFDEMAREFKKDRYRRKAYENAAEAIRSHDKPITSGLQAKQEIKGVGESIATKIDEILKTGKLQFLEERPEEKKEKERVMKIFEGIHDVGEKTAEKWYNLGYRSLEDLQKIYHTMTSSQKLGYTYYHQIKERIPRSEIDQIQGILTDLWTPLGTEFMITGSYRRGKTTSGDIDLVVRDGPVSLEMLVNKLIEKGLIVGNLSFGPSKYMGIIKLGPEYNARRIDMRWVSEDAWPYTIFYFTGSRQFVVDMRAKAKSMGLTMNEYGMTDSSGKIYPAKSEKDIFNYLGVQYLEPHQRSIISKIAYTPITPVSPIPHEEIKKEEPKKGVWYKPVPSLLLYITNGLVATENIAGFDLDWTLVRPIHGLFPKSPEDKALLPNRLHILSQAREKGYTIVIFTNQKATTENKLQLNFARVKNCIDLLADIPFILLMSTGDDIYRKPNFGMWQVLKQLIPSIKSGFYTGDAAGRPQDFSDSDKMFAQNIGLPFYLPEQIFPSIERLKPAPNIPIPTIEFPLGKNMVLFVGMQGSGKTTYYESNLLPLGYIHINQDKLGTKAKVTKLYKESLIKGLNCVIDATNPSLTGRQEFYSLAQNYGYNIITLYFVRNGQGYNKLREAPVPTIAYNMYFKNLVEPNVQNTPGTLYQIN